MKGHIFLIWFIFLSFIAHAQQNWAQEDIIELQDGRLLYGTIIKHIPNKEIHLKTADSSLYVIPTTDISVLRQAPYSYRKPAYQIEKTYTPSSERSTPRPVELDEPHKLKGYSVYLKGSFSLLNSGSASLYVGRLMTPYILLSIGSGLDGYNNFGNPFIRLTKEGISSSQLQQDYFVPIVLSSRFFTYAGRLAFTCGIEGGYSIYMPNLGLKQANGIKISESVYRKTESGGFNAALSIGLRLYMTKNTAFLYEIGARAQAYSARETRLTNPTSNSGSFSSTTVFLSNINVWHFAPFISLGILF
ncbi:MAG: hypothetical protein K2Q22_16515 [Cytophagales bacterium]|nr:hypothetical protein [Cytophagales bacterium]